MGAKSPIVNLTSSQKREVVLKEQTKMTNKLWVDVPYSVDSGIGDRAHIGMLVIDCDQTLSYEMLPKIW